MSCPWDISEWDVIEPCDTLPDGALIQRQEATMARRRYQQGSVFLRGKRSPVWVGRWLEDEVRGGIVQRRHKSEVLGTKAELPTRKLALRRLAERLAPVNSPHYKPEHKITFQQMTEKWKREILVVHKPSSQCSMNAILKKLNEDFSGVDLGDIDLPRLQRWIAAQTVSPKTLRNRLGVIRLVWKYARVCGLAQPLEFDALILPKRGLRKVHSFTAEQMRQILGAAEESFRTMLWILCETGIRGGELCGLMCDDLQGRTLHIKRSAWRGKIQTPKTANAVRVVPISAALAERLTKWTAGRSGLMFRTRTGKPYDNSNLVKWELKPLLDKLEIPSHGVGLHAFRHANASLLDSLAVPMSVRTARLGHAEASQTMQYTHAQSADHTAAADRLGEILCPGLPVNSLPC